MEFYIRNIQLVVCYAKKVAKTCARWSIRKKNMEKSFVSDVRLIEFQLCTVLLTTSFAIGLWLRGYGDRALCE